MGGPFRRHHSLIFSPFPLIFRHFGFSFPGHISSARLPSVSGAEEAMGFGRGRREGGRRNYQLRGKALHFIFPWAAVMTTATTAAATGRAGEAMAHGRVHVAPSPHIRWMNKKAEQSERKGASDRGSHPVLRRVPFLWGAATREEVITRK